MSQPRGTTKADAVMIALETVLHRVNDVSTQMYAEDYDISECASDVNYIAIFIRGMIDGVKEAAANDK